MITRIIFTLIALTLLHGFSPAQKTSIIGKVIDEKTGEVLPETIVKIVNTSRGMSTDMDGVFNFENIAPGIYTLEFKLAFYSTKKISEVEVKSGETTELKIALTPEDNTITSVDVIAVPLNQATTVALLAAQKNNASVSDGVSSDLIKKTPDKSTSDVLKRISGASIQDNKFAIVRGLNDRYNAAYLNGSPLPSSESDRKAFAFDIFPSNMLDNIVIIKTATPDLPAEFAGGVIQINTKNIPEKNFMSFTFGGGYNTITTGKNQVYYIGGKTDWLGIDDGSRNMPNAIPSQQDFPVNMHNQAALAKNANTDWNLYNKKFLPNHNFQFSFAHTFYLKKKKTDSTMQGKPLGLIMALTYNRTFNYNQTLRRGYSGDATALTSQIDYDYLDKTYSEQVLSGALANLSFKLNNNNSFSFKNIYSLNSDDRVINRTGSTNPLETNPTLLLSNARWFTGNNIYSGQFTGEHYVPKIKIKANWTGSYSQIKRVIPNLRRSIYTRYARINDPSDPYVYDTIYTANISNANVGPDYGGGMFWSENREKIYSGKGDIKYTLNISREFKTDIKVGTFYQNRSRNFFARQLGYTKYGVVGGSVNFNDSLLYLNDNQIFNSTNMGLMKPGVGGFKLTDGTKPSDAYTASSKLFAGYLMFDSKYDFIRFVYGVRIEKFNQQLNSKYTKIDSININTTKLDILPSANLILALNEKQNVRVSYSQTLNRPEYRELAPFAFYDFNTQLVISGDTSLQRAKIHNADVRYEFYPGRGQILSASGFYKYFINPIEQISRPDVSGEISFRNLNKAINYGVEFEFRALLGILFNADSSKFLNNLTLFSNLAVIRSKVNVESVIGSAYASRPLQGQAPYVLNAGLQYASHELGMSFSASLNKVGNRIAIVGNINEPDIWEKGRAFLDLQIAKSFWKKRLEIKFNAQNILAQKQNFYQNRNSSTNVATGIKSLVNAVLIGDKNNVNDYNSQSDDLIWSTNYGKIYSFTVTATF